MNELWDEQDGFFYDRLRMPDGSTLTVRARSMVGLLPVFAAVEMNASLWDASPLSRAGPLVHRAQAALCGFVYHFVKAPSRADLAGDARLRRILARMLDETEFLSPYGLSSLSRYHRDHPLVVELDGGEARLDYEPAESPSGLFGGNSNWRGPIWFPLNFLAIESLRHLHACFGEDFTVELPTGSGKQRISARSPTSSSAACSAVPADAMVAARRTANPRFQNDPAWRDHCCSMNISTATRARAWAPPSDRLDGAGGGAAGGPPRAIEKKCRCPPPANNQRARDIRRLLQTRQATLM